ncbi:MAG: hypothetical protein J6O61_13480 [Butyrivibrio sp.]|uniref:hypothetical protein n=1 Tax=Butyrivibrio sp. TaxID=28121 RepID=UPI001B197599|nr:hypothetical protein [Butyrivibrio sp.]MBO6241832.1 hypothetical protein [Butyrivibrio sp.]
MENRLSRLFDYQKYSPNADLEKIIHNVESKYSLNKEMLSDDDLEFVAAAGVKEICKDPKKGELL